MSRGFFGFLVDAVAGRRMRRNNPYRPILELLEDRLTPAMHTWTGQGQDAGFWSNPMNWAGGVPQTGEAGGTILRFNGQTVSIDDISRLTVDRIELGSGYADILAWQDQRTGVDSILSFSGTSGDSIVGDAGGGGGIDVPIYVVGANLSILLNSTPSVPTGLFLGGQISGNANVILRAGSGNAVLGLGGANTYTGDTVIEEGKLSIGLPVDQNVIPGNLIIGNDNTRPDLAFAPSVGVGFVNQVEPTSEVIADSATVTISHNGSFILDPRYSETLAEVDLTAQSINFSIFPSASATTFYFSTVPADHAIVDVTGHVGSFRVTGAGRYNTATLLTGITYVDSNGLPRETAEAVTVGATNKVQTIHADGTLSDLLTMDNFQTVIAIAGSGDQGFIYSTPGVKNVFVGAGRYAYMNTGNNAEDFYYINGAQFVYGYAAASTDYCYQYDGDGGSAFVASGTAYALMLGTDKGKGFNTVSFFNEGVGFTFNEGIAQHPGLDVAYFYDSPGNDLFNGYSLYSAMTSLTGDFQENDIAVYFAHIFAFSFVGGLDVAYVYDPTVNVVLGFAVDRRH